MEKKMLEKSKINELNKEQLELLTPADDEYCPPNERALAQSEFGSFLSHGYELLRQHNPEYTKIN